MILMVLFFPVIILLFTRKIVSLLEQQISDQVVEMKERYQKLLHKKNDVVLKRVGMERKASEIFTLYEMTKEITKKFHEKEAFEVFLKNLKENVSFEDCRFVDVQSQDLKEIRAAGYYLFLLTEKRKKLGYLAFKGVPEEHRDKVSILGHQFALALRRVKLYVEIEKLAITDSLTGVHTRRYFWERFEEELKRSAMRKLTLSFLMIDVDFFKSFNDRYGHLAGDQILKEVAIIIKESIREIDIAGRYGGEEFCIVLPDTDRDRAYYVAERIRSSVENTPIKAYDVTVKATVSIGLANSPLDGELANELMDKADWALFRAKKSGRNCICAFGVYK